MDKIRDLGPDADLDINNVTMRFAMDVTGLVGFAKDYETCSTFDDACTDDLFDILRKGLLFPEDRAKCKNEDCHVLISAQET